MSSPVTSLIGDTTRRKLDPELTCPQCHRWFQIPILLPCGHSLCTKCAQHLLTENFNEQPLINDHESDHGSISSESDSGVGFYSRPTSSYNYTLINSTNSSAYALICPQCRKSILLPKNGVKDLPLNRALEALVTRYTNLEEDYNSPVNCQLCPTEGKAASFVCEQCELAYCSECFSKQHPLKEPFTNHTTYEASYGRVVLRHKQRMRPVPCSRHNKYSISLFCLTCRLVLCEACREEKHKNHNVKQANEVCKAQKKELSQTLQSLAEKAKIGATFIRTMKTMLDRTNENSRLEQESIESQIDDLIASLESKKAELRQSATTLREDKEHRYKSQISQSTALLGRLTTLIQLCVEIMRESEASAFLQVSRTLAVRVGHAGNNLSQAIEQAIPKNSPDFELQLNTESLERSIKSLNFIHTPNLKSPVLQKHVENPVQNVEAPNPPIFYKEECTTEANVITTVWQPYPGTHVERYTLEIDDGALGPFRKVYRGEETMCTIEGLHFRSSYRLRVKSHGVDAVSPYSEGLCLCTSYMTWFTMNPERASPSITFTNENTTIRSHLSENQIVLANTGLSKGVHYWEFTVDSYEGPANMAVGIAKQECVRQGILGRDTLSWAMHLNCDGGHFMHNGEHFEENGGGFTGGVVIGVCIDCDNSTLRFYLNDQPYGHTNVHSLPKGGHHIFYPAVGLCGIVQLTLHTGLELPSDESD